MIAIESSSSISIVIPSRNEGAWIQRTVEAVWSEDFPRPIEIIVVDDGSDDQSCDFLGLPPWHEKVKLIRGEGIGLQHARNLGATQASGEILLFMDAHVLPDPGWLEEFMQILSDPTVGLAGVAIRNFEHPSAVGFKYGFVDENLSATWLAATPTAPIESPCVPGGCCGMRRAVFERLGGWDPGSLRWGVDDIEMSLRTWYSGYRCIISPRVQVAHYFKEIKSRNFNVSWEEYDNNLLRCVYTYFSGRRLNAILTGLSQRPNFEATSTKILNDELFQQRRQQIRSRFERNEDWYFDRFAEELHEFESRLNQLQQVNDQKTKYDETANSAAASAKRGSRMPELMRKVICAHCQATNVGTHKTCMLCNSPLPEFPNALKVSTTARSAPTATQSPLSPFQPVVTGSACARCGSKLPDSAKWCPACGDAVAATRPARCPNPACQTEVQVNQAFCYACGIRISQPALASQAPVNFQHHVVPAQPRVQPQYCPNPQCRRPIQPGKNFCTICGARV